MKQKIIGMLALFLAATQLASAQSTGSIKGKILDEFGEPMPFAGVYVKQGEVAIGANTDLDGKFELKPLNAGTYNLTVSFIGYQTKTIQGIRVNPDEITFVKSIGLTASSIGLPDAEVIEWKIPLINAEETGKMTMLSAQLETNANLRSPALLLSSFTPEIKVSADGREVSFRGARAGSVVYFLDGIKMNEIPNVPARGIASYTVYTGGIPAKYGDTTGGVVIIETKSFNDLYNQRAYN